MRLRLVWRRAATLPITIEAMATKYTMTFQRSYTVGSPSVYVNTRMSAANAATLVVTLMNVVTDVGAPWYTSGVHVWNGAALILNARPTKRSAMPAMSSGSTRVARALQRRADLGQLGVPGLPVDQRHAEEQEARREAAEQQVLQRCLLGARLVAVEPAEDVERDREQLDGQEDDHQAARPGEEHHAGGRRQDQRVVLAVMHAAAVEVVRADQQHQRGAHQDDRVDEQPEAVVGERPEVHGVRRGRVEPAPHRRRRTPRRRRPG